MAERQVSAYHVVRMIEQVPEPPCDHHEVVWDHNVKDHVSKRVVCLEYDRCAEERLACQAFSRYIHTTVHGSRGVRRQPGEIPSRGLYRRIYREENDECV